MDKLAVGFRLDSDMLSKAAEYGWNVDTDDNELYLEKCFDMPITAIVCGDGFIVYDFNGEHIGCSNEKTLIDTQWYGELMDIVFIVR